VTERLANGADAQLDERQTIGDARFVGEHQAANRNLPGSGPQHAAGELARGPRAASAPAEPASIAEHGQLMRLR
jgi:hypothetical protein